MWQCFGFKQLTRLFASSLDRQSRYSLSCQARRMIIDDTRLLYNTPQAGAIAIANGHGA
jgi:hypothetical protein